MERTKSGLFVPRLMFVKKHYRREKTVTLPDGRRARVSVDDSNTVKQTETDDTLDALVRPRTLAVRLSVLPDRSTFLERLRDGFRS